MMEHCLTDRDAQDLARRISDDVVGRIEEVEGRTFNEDEYDHVEGQIYEALVDVLSTVSIPVKEPEEG